MSTRKAIVFSFGDRYAGLIVHTASSMVIARLLTPSEIGIYSLAMVLLGFVSTFRDLGAGQYLIQRKSLEVDDIRAVWAVQLGLGVLLGAIIVLGSEPVAHFYRDKRVGEIMLVLALNFVVTPFLAYPNAWITREMRFGTLAGIRFSGAVAHALFAVALTMAGVGPVALAWANLAATLVGIVVTVMIGRASLPWMPRLSGVTRVISFGGKLTLASLVGTANSAAPELFLGRLQGMTETGLFSRAQSIVFMFERLVMEGLNAVAFPFFAKQSREGNDAVASFLQISSLVTALGWSFFGCLGVLAYPAVRVLYGDQWDLAVDPTRWLAIAAAVFVPAMVCRPPLIARGAVSQVLVTSILTMVVQASAAGLGAYLGLLSLTQLMIPAFALSTAMWLVLTRRQLGFRWVELFAIFARSAVLAVASVTVPLAVSVYFGWRSTNVLGTLVIAIPGAALGFLVAARATRHLVWEEIVRAAKSGRSRGKVG